MQIANIEDIYRLSPAQHGILFEELSAPAEGRYTVQVALTLSGHVDHETLARAVNLSSQRHPILRTSFHWQNAPQPLQVVHKSIEVPLTQLDWHELSEAERDARFAELLAEDSRRGFNVTRAPLFRLTLIRTTIEQWQLLFSYHHLLLDGWSLPLFLGEIISSYETLVRGEQSTLPPPPRPFRDYITWLQQRDQAEAERFWREYLRGFDTRTPLPLIEPVQLDVSGEPRLRRDACLSAEATEKLGQVARSYKLTLNTLVQGAWALVLSRFSGASEVVFGETVAGRPPDIDGVERMFGLFINTLPVRVRIPTDTRVCDWLQALQDQNAEAREYEYAPLVDIQRWSEVERGEALFDSLFAFENYPLETGLQESWHSEQLLRLEGIESFERTSFPLTLAAAPARELTLRIGCDARKFRPSAVERVCAHLTMLLEAFAESPEARVCDLPTLTFDEVELLAEWNNTHKDYGPYLHAQELFEQHASLGPNQIAVVWSNQQLTYGELDKRANRLARYLRATGIRPESRVGILFGRTGEMIVAILGVLKAGAAYVPLDPEYPRERIAHAVKDSGAPIVLTSSSFLERLDDEINARIVCLDQENDRIAHESDERLRVQIEPENLAYVIYTSGSTGTPKGVAVHHAALSNLLRWYQDRYGVSREDRLTNVAGHAFDASLWEIWPCLTSGATLYMLDAERASATELLQTLKVNAITNCFAPTPLAEKLLPLLEELQAENTCALRHLSAGGDALRSRPKASMSFAFDNVYGPTECTIASVTATIGPETSESRVPPVGRPIANTQIHVLDANLRTAPIGATGEIYIGGNGVARGYLEQPALTAERFIPNLFRNDGTRMYRTGDLGRWTDEGELEFICRVDDQVKIRGQRLEPREVEVALCRHPSVSQAEVLARELDHAGKVLVAYVVMHNGDEPPTTSAFREHLRSSLPEYMIPAAFVVLDRMPLTANGKIDRRALPLPQHPRERAGEMEMQLRTPTEEIVANIWSELLQVKNVSGRDHFFELGGHSLLAIQLVSRVKQTFIIELPLRTILEFPTLSDFAARVDHALRNSLNGHHELELTRMPRPAALPLSFAQQRIWSSEQLDGGGALYNITTAVRLNGDLRVDVLERCVGELIRRHEALRTSFKFDGRSVTQVVNEPMSFKFECVDLSALDEAERSDTLVRLGTEEAKRRFDLATAPLLRVLLLRMKTDEHVVVLVTHHIVSDAWSLSVMLSEIGKLYAAYVKDDPSPLTELNVQYADYALWQQERLRGELLDLQLSYWRRKLAEPLPVVDLAMDHARLGRMTFRGARESFVLPEELSAKLGVLSRQVNATLFMTLLAGFKSMLCLRLDQDDLIVGTPLAGRDRIEIEGVVGCFIKTLPLRTDLSGDPNFREVIKRVRETTLGAHAHADVPFEKLGNELRSFQVTFGMQNVPQRPVETSGLQLRPLSFDDEIARFDLTVWMVAMGGRLGSTWTYNTDLLDAETIRELHAQFERVLSAAVEQPEMPISRLELRSEAEREELARVSRARFTSVKPKLVSVGGS